MTAALAMVAIVKAYLATGAVVALAFLALGMRSDPAARGAYAFRLLILPGLILLWPLVIWRWAATSREGSEPKLKKQHAAHALIWMLISVTLGAALILATLNRRVKLPDPPSQRLSLPGDSISGEGRIAGACSSLGTVRPA